MKCDVCKIGEIRPRKVRYVLDLDDRIAVIEHVPAEVCDHCGEQSFAPGTVERLREILDGAQAPVRMLETPVYEYTPAEAPAAAGAKARR